MELICFHGDQLCGYLKKQEYLTELIMFLWQSEPQQGANTTTLNNLIEIINCIIQTISLHVSVSNICLFEGNKYCK